MQQEASNKLGFSAKKTMMIAQKLYEGIELKDETTGLITYMRTDSTRLSEEFVNKAFKYIEENYGKSYIGYVKKTNKTENTQDAHESIRPTYVKYEPDTIKDFLSPDEYKLYKLIYCRAIASLMKDASCDATTVILNNNDYKFKTNGQVLTFDGYLKVYGDYEESEDKILPNFRDYHTDILIAEEITPSLHHTKPPARYTEAKLIKELEELGIGRPSTYAKIVDTLKMRNYVEIIDKKFVPLEVGIDLTDKLQEAFSSIINVEYTSLMENDLDKIAEGEAVWYEILKEFYDKFEPLVDDAYKNLEKSPVEETGEHCPECGGSLVVRTGKYGDFVACGNFPKCKYIKKEEQEPKEENIVIKCPNCEEGNVVEKKTRKGKTFYGCNNYPKCKTAYWDKPIEESCPLCKSLLVETKTVIKCPNCDYVK